MSKLALLGIKVKKHFWNSSMCKSWGGVRIWIWIGIKMESRIQIRIGIKTMPIHNTARYTYCSLFGKQLISPDAL